MRTTLRAFATLALVALSAAFARTAGAQATTTINFDVEAPSWTQTSVFVSLDQAVNGNRAWDANEVALHRDSSGRWVGSIQLPTGTTFQWKVTGGGWNTVEKGWSGGEVSNRSSTANGNSMTAYAHVFHWASDTIFPPPSSILDLGQFAPRTLSSRLVQVRMPPGYDDHANAGRRYPVLYALDGNNLFAAESDRSFTGVTWDLDDAQDQHCWDGGAPFIVVAIDNTPGRADEYTESYDASEQAGGKLEDFASFVLNELKPTIDWTFRTSLSADDTGIMGSSLGGLAALNIGLKHSDRVHRVGALSASIWWNNEDTVAYIRSLGQKPPLRIWLDVGTGEPSSQTQGARDARDALVNLGFSTSDDLCYNEFPGATHDEGSWAARTPWILSYMFH
jgi:pullulanase